MHRAVMLLYAALVVFVIAGGLGWLGSHPQCAVYLLSQPNQDAPGYSACALIGVRDPRL